MWTDNSSLLPYALIAVDAELAANDIAKNWGWILAAGIINLFAGIFALLAPTAATTFVVVFLSVVLIFAGFISIFSSCFNEAGFKTQAFVLGVVEVTLGLLLQFYPFESFMIITIMIAVMFMCDGLFRCAVALQNRGSPTWVSTLISGMSAVAFSILVMLAFPMSSLYTLGIIVGVNLIFIGMARISIATTGRQIAVDRIEGRAGANAGAIA